MASPPFEVLGITRMETAAQFQEVIVSFPSNASSPISGKTRG
jgi:hypothetical protein